MAGATGARGGFPGRRGPAVGRLGYPRRALRLHASAQAITERYGGVVPDSLEELRALPGVGSYTAAAVASFAFGQRHAVLDTNVRRVLARLMSGALRAAPNPTAIEAKLAETLLPEEPGLAPRWSVAVMELGALICTADRPQCPDCPVVSECAWHRAGQPADDPHKARRRSQGYEGTDRQCRGRLLAVLRESEGPVPAALLDVAWADADQRARSLASLVADGLAEPLSGGCYALPR